MTQIGKVHYTAKVQTIGGRHGAAHSSDDRLNIKLSIPGAPGDGTNPEQLFAAAWTACFLSAIDLVAAKARISLPSQRLIDCEIDLGTANGGYSLSARLNVSLPGLAREVAQSLIDAAHQICPYSKATRGNIDVTINLA